ncbi:hypothetical protein B0H11DRAFT_835256 [Mycena galericulata]|nr:hypothetical protein B0H11DRAFT_835256 [Mycena galericulata]
MSPKYIVRQRPLFALLISTPTLFGRPVAEFSQVFRKFLVAPTQRYSTHKAYGQCIPGHHIPWMKAQYLHSKSTPSCYTTAKHGMRPLTRR